MANRLGFDTCLWLETFLYLGWPMSIYRELIRPSDISRASQHIHLSARSNYCIIDLPTDQISRSFPFFLAFVMARLCCWP